MPSSSPVEQGCCTAASSSGSAPLASEAFLLMHRLGSRRFCCQACAGQAAAPHVSTKCTDSHTGDLPLQPVYLPMQ